MNTIGFRVKSLREKHNLSQKQFAERIMVSQSYLSRIERNVEIPNKKLIKLIGLEFNTNTDWIEKGLGLPDTNNKETSHDYYDRAYIENFLEVAQEELQRFSHKVVEYRNAEIARNICAICGELTNLFDNKDDTLKGIIGEIMGSIILEMCEQFGKFSRDIQRQEFYILKMHCIDTLFDELNTLEEYMDNRDLK